jgi:putative flavoprotein involved in K+ transport
MPEAKVVVVGAGPAGLSAAGALARLGVPSVVLEQDDEIGARWASRYERLCLHTVRRFSGLAHYPLPATLPRYVPKDDFAAYLRDYAARLALDVRLGQEVRRIRRDDGFWVVETNASPWRSCAVVVATGKHDRPVLPKWPGRDAYRGRLIHATGYRSGFEYAGKDVLVVGLGNTGAEIAADLVESEARRVAVAVRTPPPITRRDVVGVPIQLLGLAGSLLPPSLGDRLASAMRRVAIGDLSRHGLGAPEWGPFTARRPPVIDIGFLRALRAGEIEILPALESFGADDVVFADGRRERFDTVIAATGYRNRLGELLGLDGRPLDRQLPRGIYLIGFRESVRGVLFETRRDSLALARAIARELASAS